MVGMVGYVWNDGMSPEGPLDSMAGELRHFPFHLTDQYRCDSVHVARVHLGTFNPTKQPVFSEDDRLGIVAEGMAYGKAIDAMPPQGTDGDMSEHGWLGLLLRSYGKEGLDAFRALNGSFSALIFDREQGAVHLVSDRFGTRPMYYWTQGKDFVFASEAKAILKYPYYRKKLSRAALGKFFRYGRLGMWGDDTWFEGIRVLPPGSILTAEKGKTKTTQYWDIAYTPTTDSVDSFSEKLKVSFRHAVALRTSNGSLKYSVALSGGLDSRAVLAACGPERNVTAYTFGMYGSHELVIASRVAQLARTRHLVCALDPDEAAKHAEEVVDLSDGMETVALSFLLQADKLFRGSVDVSLDGFALDLTLGGSFLRKNVMDAESLAQLAGILDKKFTLFGQGELGKLLYPEYLEGTYESAEVAFRGLVSQAKGRTLADKADYFALKTRVRSFTIMGHVLTRNYFEDTIPTFDNEFMELVTSIPADLRFHYGVYRKFLRALSTDLSKVPYERTGFSPNYPQPVWFLGIVLARAFLEFNRALCRVTKGRVVRFDLNGYVDHSSTLRTGKHWKELTARTLANPDSLMYRHRIVNRDYVLGLVDGHISGRRDNREKILYLITFELLLRRFFADGLGN